MLDMDEINKVLCNGQGEWTMDAKNELAKHMDKKYFTPKEKLWCALVQGVVIPIKHFNIVTKKRLLYTYVLMKQLPVNVGSTISNEILDCRRTTASLNYKIIITKLCASQGVRIDPRELKDAKGFGPIDRSFFYRYIFNNFYGPNLKGNPFLVHLQGLQ
jgi:hypothetical protein